VPVGAAPAFAQVIVRLGALANTAGGAGSTVIVLVAVMVLLHASVNVQVSVYEPPQAVCEPVIVPVTLPDISQTPVSPFVYDKEVGAGAAPAAAHVMVRFGAVANTAGGAGSIVIVLVAVMVLLQASVNVQVSVYEPPQAVCEPVTTPVTEPLISQLPV
jgi:uncharacterized membrane protein